MDLEHDSRVNLLEDGEPFVRLNIDGSIYDELWRTIVDRDIERFKNLIGSKDGQMKFDVDHEYPNHYQQTCLDFACSEGLRDFVEILLKAGANPNRISQNLTPLHLATQNKHYDVLKLLLNEPRTNVNIIVGGRTPLHTAVKDDYLEGVDLLLTHDGDPNLVNNANCTAFHWAVRKKLDRMVMLIIEKSKFLVVDEYKDGLDKTALDYLRMNYPDIPTDLDKFRRTAENVDLQACLNEGKYELFLELLDKAKPDDLQPALLTKAVANGFHKGVEKLLGKIRGEQVHRSEAAMAARKGDYRMLEILLKEDPKLGSSELLCEACSGLGLSSCEGNSIVADRVECIRLILKEGNANVRYADGKGNTPLHYAARANCPEAIKLLLKNGCYINQRNRYNAPPLADIPANILSDYFDDCLRGHKNDANDDDYTIEFDYTCLMPKCVSGLAYQSSSKAGHEESEMQALEFIAENKNLKHLLKHPLLSSFLYTKWHRIRDILYANLAFYILFYSLLNAYILSNTDNNYGKISKDSNGSKQDDDVRRDRHRRSSSPADTTMELHRVIGVLWIGTLICLLILCVRESVQMLSSPRRYFSSGENYAEIFLIVLVMAVLKFADPQVDALVILLSAWKLVFLIGQQPRWSTHIEMFKTVTMNFLRFLIVYGFLILAFAFAFFTLFREEGENFPNPGHSIFKTVIMLTGEFDANDIPFIRHPILSRFIFMLFVFLIAIVLFNLLNGLAVNDTAEILSEAELVGLISRIRMVAYIEQIIMGEPCLHWSPFSFLKSSVFVFPEYLVDGKLNVKMQSGADKRAQNAWWDACEKMRYIFCESPQMDKHIIGQAKGILARKDNVTETQKIQEELALIKDKLDSLARVLQSSNFEH